MEYIVKNYNDIKMVEHTTSYDTFRIFDKPAEGKVMVTSSLGAAAAGGFVKGLTFGASGPAVSKPIFQEAIEDFLAKSGRTCRIMDGYLLVDPQWEFRYDCIPAVAQQISPPIQATGSVKR
jgi:hypothetical protein